MISYLDMRSIFVKKHGGLVRQAPRHRVLAILEHHAICVTGCDPLIQNGPVRGREGQSQQVALQSKNGAYAPILWPSPNCLYPLITLHRWKQLLQIGGIYIIRSTESFLQSSKQVQLRYLNTHRLACMRRNACK